MAAGERGIAWPELIQVTQVRISSPATWTS
jgi:hypothetical protein